MSSEDINLLTICVDLRVRLSFINLDEKNPDHEKVMNYNILIKTDYMRLIMQLVTIR